MRGVSAVLLSLLLFTGCGTAKYVSSTISPKWDAAGVIRIAVIPFAYAPEAGEKGFKSDKEDLEEIICFKMDKFAPGLRSAKVAPEGVTLITGMFLRGLEKEGYRVIPFDDDEKKEICSNGTLSIEVIKSIGEKSAAEAVMTGIVTRYEEREGGAWGVRKPSSVGFEASLISTEDGNLLWSGHYAETQKSLVEDLSLIFTFIRRGGRWLSAEELARDGVKKVLKQMPGPRQKHPAHDN